MSVTLHQPADLPEVDLYRHVSVATGSRMVFLAGQVSWNAQGELVGEDDLAAQVEQCYVNVAAALAEVGATFADVAKLTVYFTDWTPDKLEVFMQGRDRAFARLGVSTHAPFTGIGVAALAGPGLLVEIEAVAILD